MKIEDYELESQNATHLFGWLIIVCAIFTLITFIWLDYRTTAKETLFYIDPLTKCEYFEETKTPRLGSDGFPLCGNRIETEYAAP